MDREPFASDRWAMIITLLSMDVVIAFDDLMGLVVPDRQAFLSGVRSIILDMRRDYAAGGPFYSAKRVSDGLTDGLGAELRDHVAWWGRTMFESSTQDHADLGAWTITLRHCRHEAARWEQLGLPSGISAEARRNFMHAVDTTEYEKRNEEVYAKPLSDWDLHMYALNGFDDENELVPSGPSTYVYPTVMTYRGYRFWAWLLRQLTTDEQTALAKNATRIAESTQSLKFLGELPHPSKLEVGL